MEKLVYPLFIATLLALVWTSCKTLPKENAADPAEVKAIEQVIENLFDGMAKGDSSQVRQCFHPSMTLVSVAIRTDGTTVVQETTPALFLEMVGMPHEALYDERISNIRIRIDGHFADAWMDYKFFLGREFSHCGVNAMHFAKVGGQWKILRITDTRRRKDCGDTDAGWKSRYDGR